MMYKLIDLFAGAGGLTTGFHFILHKIELSQYERQQGCILIQITFTL
ncbi:hypothetical protein [Scytonema sp. UIC 10036]|nr:hypothetical protein [Scytonema sp. UIC 10036]